MCFCERAGSTHMCTKSDEYLCAGIGEAFCRSSTVSFQTSCKLTGVPWDGSKHKAQPCQSTLRCQSPSDTLLKSLREVVFQWGTLVLSWSSLRRAGFIWKRRCSWAVSGAAVSVTACLWRDFLQSQIYTDHLFRRQTWMLWIFILLCYEKQPHMGLAVMWTEFFDHLSEATHVQGQLRLAQWPMIMEKQVS